MVKNGCEGVFVRRKCLKAHFLMLRILCLVTKLVFWYLFSYLGAVLVHFVWCRYWSGLDGYKFAESRFRKYRLIWRGLDHGRRFNERRLDYRRWLNRSRFDYGQGLTGRGLTELVFFLTLALCWSTLSGAATGAGWMATGLLRAGFVSTGLFGEGLIMGAGLTRGLTMGAGLIEAGLTMGKGFTWRGLTEAGFGGPGLVGVVAAEELLLSSETSLEFSLFQLFLLLSLAFKLGAVTEMTSQLANKGMI